MSWGGLNPALASWRAGLNALLPARSTRSDGGRADSDHASTSQHQPDPDGTVDAFDEDRNYLGSADQDGNADEDRIKAALDADFMADPRAHLIISDRKIRNSEIGDWEPRDYDGSSPHTEHTHRQAHQSRERDGRPWQFTRTRAVLADIRGDLPVDAAQQQQLADRIAKAIMDSPVMVNGVPWKYSTAIGYLARKAYEVDGTLDAAADRIAEHLADIEAAAAVTPSANTGPADAVGG